MNKDIENKNRNGKRIVSHTILIAAGIAINLLGVQVVQWLSAPLYLDVIGTVVAAAVGGIIPGVMVGFFTNVISGIQDYTSTFFSSTSAMIALVSAYCAHKGWFRRWRTLPIIVVLLALIGGGIGSVLTWFLFGGGIGESVSSPLAERIYAGGKLGIFLSHLSADMLIDLADKTITVLAAALILRLLPQRLYERFGREAKALSSVAASAGKDGAYKQRMSLRAKVFLMITAAALVITVGISAISLTLYNASVLDEKSHMAKGVANVAAASFDPDQVPKYLAEGEAAAGYGESMKRLEDIVSSATDIDFVYVYQIREDGCYVVFDPDTEGMEGGEPGDFVPFDESFRPYLPALLAGEEIEPLVTNDSFGWLLTVYRPVYDSAGVCQCYVGVDISMHRLLENETMFLARVVSLFIGFFLLVLAVGVWAADRGIILPIKAMAAVTGAFVSDSEEARKNSIERIRSLDISSGDEIENLHRSIQTMTEDVVRYVEDVQNKTQQISRMQNGLIMVLADMVESRDKCTGNHVRNTATYAKLIMEKLREQGVYADQLTDEFIYDVYNGAPLHDVGKVQVSDTLLNKPGRLTDSEFLQMKDHTVSGGEIIDRAIAMLGEGSSTYLAEAKNLTLYHHERWDGKGYPAGLAGEEIPLSARIMAVADVFDALVARRSYKEGFPFEKAIEIITLESGTHFDPKIVDAFLACQEEVRVIAEEANQKSLSDY